MVPFARHTLLEFHGCDPALLRNAEALKPCLLEAVREGRGTIVTDFFHNFSPYGVSGVIVIAESHVAIHTWPEHGFAAVDIFSCSELLDQDAIAKLIGAALGSERVTSRTIDRNGNGMDGGARLDTGVRVG